MVYTLLANGFEEIEALSVVDILRRAEIVVKTISISDDSMVCGAHGINVIADTTLDQTDMNFDVLFLPGGYPGYVNLENEPKVLELIKNTNTENKIIAAICAAPSILGKLEFLVGKKACCFPSFEDKLVMLYFHYFMFIIDEWCKKNTNAGGLLSVNMDGFKKLTIPYPSSLSEQRKIAECFVSLDKQIDFTKKKLEQLKEHKKGLMQRLFPAEGKTVPELRFHEFMEKE